jgi:NadR type nicotinamide-nucleotide adenylyltransferase
MGWSNLKQQPIVPIKRIAIIGPESTGKTTLAQDLSAKMGIPWVTEYAREFIERLGRPYEEADLWEIAKGQIRNEDNVAKAHQEANLMLCDTCLHVIRVWSESKYGRCSREVLMQIAERRYDGYLLAGVDVAWQADPQREHPSPEARGYFYQVYRETAISSGVRWTDLCGSREERVRQAEEWIGGLWKRI